MDIAMFIADDPQLDLFPSINGESAKCIGQEKILHVMAVSRDSTYVVS